MAANRIQIKASDTNKKITIPLGDTFDEVGREQLINTYEEVELQDNLELQQVPREYAELLCFLRDNKTHSYLNIGIGNGGSFLLETFIQKDLKKSVAVDNMSYGRMSNLANAEKRINWLKKNMSAQIKFYNLDSSLYFNYNTNFYKDTFDVIY